MGQIRERIVMRHVEYRACASLRSVTSSMTVRRYRALGSDIENREALDARTLPVARGIEQVLVEELVPLRRQMRAVVLRDHSCAILAVDIATPAVFQHLLAGHAHESPAARLMST